VECRLVNQTALHPEKRQSAAKLKVQLFDHFITLFCLHFRMGETNSEGAFLELTTRPIKFGPASTANAVFYDEGRREILSVDSNGIITGTEIKEDIVKKKF
jgi:hypothetical protein